MRLRFKPNAIPEMKENERIYFYPMDNKGRWSEIFENSNPIYIEIGAGMGDFIVKIAKDNPDINFIALEMNANAFVVASRKFIKEGLNNIRGVIANAENIDEIFDKGEISHIYINFSTPWPKNRHHKRRLSHKRFLDKYKNIVKDGAIIEQKTDNREFFDDSLEYFNDYGLEILEYDYNLDEEKSIITEYESKWREKNIPINYVKAKFILNNL